LVVFTGADEPADCLRRQQQQQQQEEEEEG